MEKSFLRKIMIWTLIILIGGGLIVNAQEIDGINYETEVVRVLKVGETESLGDDFFVEDVQKIEVEVLTGDMKGEILTVDNNLSDNLAYNLYFKEGAKATISIEKDIETGEEYINIIDHYRLDYIKYLMIVFAIIVVLIGREKGLRALVSLTFTILAIIYMVLPYILKGYNPIIISIIASIIITIVTIVLITGWTSKSFSAIVGTSLGVLISGIISYYIGSKINLTGLSADDSTMLMFIPQGIDFNFQQLLFSGIILGALGAVMDVGMSVASSVDEIYKANPMLSIKELWTAGLNIGRDVMGTMINTLVLAYAGTSIPSLLLFMAYDSTLMEVVNLDLIATEIVRSISGSIGLVLTIPVTAIISAILLKKKENDEIKE